MIQPTDEVVGEAKEKFEADEKAEVEAGDLKADEEEEEEEDEEEDGGEDEEQGRRLLHQNKLAK
jgi:hypothetical protein